MANQKLEEAKLSRERWEAVYGVFKEIIERANLSREDMIKMCERLPNFDKQHAKYLETAAYPDYKSFFTEIISLYMSN